MFLPLQEGAAPCKMTMQESESSLEMSNMDVDLSYLGAAIIFALTVVFAR